MSTLDIVLLVPLAFGLVKGFMRGFIIEVASLVALVVGIYGAIHFSFYAEELIKNNADLEGSTLSIAAFATTFIIIVLAIHLGARMLQKVLSLAALGLVNRFAGALFGLLKWGIISSFAVVFLNGVGGGLGLISDDSKKDSFLYQPIALFGPTVLPLITESSWYKELDLDKATELNIEI